MSLSTPLVAFAGSLAASLAGTGLVLRVLTRHAIFDRPNARSSHSGLVPRGGGIAVVPVIAAAWIAVGSMGGESASILIVAASTLALAALSWIDDVRDLLPIVRLLGQAASVAFVLFFAPADAPYFQGLLPPALDRLAAGLLWVWFINLFNFMDGIDGISGIEAASIGIGVAAVAVIIGPPPLALYGITAAGAALGFLWWNWHPAKVFLGDVGSAGLGFALGWLLLTLAASGAWAAALILPLYYLADATITLLKRLLRGERVWEAHRQHFYQRAVQAGKSHAEVALLVLLVDAALVGFALVAANGYVWFGLAGAGAVTGGLLLYFNTLSLSLSSA